MSDPKVPWSAVFANEMMREQPDDARTAPRRRGPVQVDPRAEAVRRAGEDLQAAIAREMSAADTPAASAPDARAVLAAIREILSRYTFVAANEADLQAQVTRVLAGAGLAADREVRSDRGVFDVRVSAGGCTVVLELKLRGSAEAVERQAQRYARAAGVDAVAVVTTSQRLAAALTRPDADTLAGKPFDVIALRGF